MRTAERRYYDLLAPEYEDWALAQGPYAGRAPPGFYNELERLFDIVSGLAGRVLEVGCGTGIFTRRLTADVVALDQSEAMLAEARKSCPGVRFVRGDALALPFPEGSFDLVFAAHVYSHLRPGDRERFLKEAARVAPSLVLVDSALRPGQSPEGVQRRRLRDGTEHHVYKRFFGADDLAEELDGGVLFTGEWFVAVGRGPAAARRVPAEPARDRSTLVCLLPARNVEADLPDWFESVERFADAVVALDDGSTDGTQALLRAHPLVRVLLTNPRRADYQSWDDLANRNRLLTAAAELKPNWIVSLDADERIPADEAAALRAFVDTDALPGCAYSFRIFRMDSDQTRYEGVPTHVARLFAFEAGQRFAGPRLHLVPVPESIPWDRWLETTIRVQHLGSSDDERRRARVDKYGEADPEQALHPDYSRLARPLGEARPWEPRPADLPVLAREARRRELGLPDVSDVDLDAPALSAIVIAHGDERTIERTVRSVVEQEVPATFEVIVVTSGGDRTAEIVRTAFPEAGVIELPRPALPGEARNAGLRVARGDYVSFPGSHVELPPGSLAARLAAHEAGAPMVSGVPLPGGRTPAGLASYFLDHSLRLPGRPSGPIAGPPAACSYVRDLLLAVGGFREDVRAGEDTRVNLELTLRGYRGWFSNEVGFVHNTPCRNTLKLVRHKFVRGRALGAILRERYEAGGRSPRSAMRGYIRERLASTSANVERWGGELRRTYRLVYPLVVVAVLANWAGVWYELLRTRPARRPIGAALAAELDAFGESRLTPYVEEFRARTFDGRLKGVPLDGVAAGEAALLYALVRHLGPRRVLQLGTNGLTQVAAAACEVNAADGHSAEFVVVDERPRLPAAGLLGVTSVEPGSELPAESLAALEPGDVVLLPDGVQIDGVRPGVVLWRAGRYEIAGEPATADGYEALARAAARGQGVPEELFLALVGRETGWRQTAASPVGAVGLAQLMPETAATLGVDPHDPQQNLEGGARYLRQQYDRFGTWELALAAYNAGPDAVAEYGGVPPYPETEHFVRAVLQGAESR